MHVDILEALAGALVGFTVGLTGMGGGALMTPMLILLFGVSPGTAVSSDLLTSLVMKPVGGTVHFRRGTVDWGLVRWLVVGSVPAAFTGYISQQNFDSQWISTQAKDGINATGAGAFWNVLNFGQMLLWHVLLLPLVVAVVVGIHVLQVRRRGVVPPFAASAAATGIAQVTPPLSSPTPDEPSSAPRPIQEAQ